MTPKLLVAAFLLNVGSLSAVELRGVVVESTEGIFLINNLKVDGSGTDQSFRVKWNLNYAQIRRSHRRWSCGGSGSGVNSIMSQVVFSAVSLPV